MIDPSFEQEVRRPGGFFLKNSTTPDLVISCEISSAGADA
jgi:hypothetical protein